MPRPTIVLLSAALLSGCGGTAESVASGTATSAITYGSIDGDAHPNAGALMLLFTDGVWRPTCSGVLVGSRTFLTAGHCVAPFAGVPEAIGYYGVTFLPRALNEPPRIGRAVLHPDYVYLGGEAAWNDYAVILLDEEAAGITPARLPHASQLDELAASNGLRDEWFTVVGYGSTEQGGGARWRRFAHEGFLALTPRELQLSQNPSLEFGGGCEGDSGGPNFLEDTDLVVSITTSGDHACRALNTTGRLDTPEALGFLAVQLE